MSASLESVLVSLWQQSLIDKKKTVDLGDIYPVRQTSKSKLKQIDFHFEDRDLRGIEQNPNTKSRWAKWRGKGSGLCSSLNAEGISRSLWTEEFTYIRSFDYSHCLRDWSISFGGTLELAGCGAAGIPSLIMAACRFPLRPHFGQTSGGVTW